MALHGEFKTFPFPDLLQWLEGSRKTGCLTISEGDSDRTFVLRDGAIIRYGVAGLWERLTRILRLLSSLDVAGGRMAVEAARATVRAEDAFSAAGVPEPLLREVARDDAMQAATDLFDDATAHFHFADDVDDGEETVRVDLSLRELLYEAARRHDEAGPAGQIIASDATRLIGGVAKSPAPRGLSAAALAAVGASSTVGAVRLALGISRAGAARILFELWRDARIRVDGAEAPRPDPLTNMLTQGEQLLAGGHFDAAALVFSSLLAADPTDRRVREFARAVEREHVGVLYGKLLPVAVPRLVVPESSLGPLRQDERIVAGLLNDRWDVSTLVLASPLRELQTLRALNRMSELGYVELRKG